MIIERTYIVDGVDFTTLKLQSSGGRPQIDYLLNKDAAISIILVSGGQFAKKLRDYVIDLFKKHETGLAFTVPQIQALMEISISMTLVSLQEDSEKRHFILHNNKYDWWSYRWNLLGYTPDEMKEAMAKVNKKYKNIKQALLEMDGFELIRTGVIDLFMAMGKDKGYSTNIGDLCKDMAIKMNLNRIIWDDTKPNPLGINKESVNERKEMFSNSIKQLKP